MCTPRMLSITILFTGLFFFLFSFHMFFLCCADSEATAKREIEFFFPEFNMEKWFQEMGNVFSAGQVEFNSDTCEHVPVGKQMPAH